MLPAGVFDDEAEISISELRGAPSARIDAPAVQIDATQPLEGTAILSLVWTEEYVENGGLYNEEDYRIFAYDADMDEWNQLPGGDVDVANRTARVALSALGQSSGRARDRRRPRPGCPS